MDYIKNARDKIAERKIWGGIEDPYPNWGLTPFPFVKKAIEQQLQDFWMTNQVKDLFSDKTDFENLPQDWRASLCKTLARVLAADHAQTYNLSGSILPLITAPCVKRMLQAQTYAEVNHTDAYLAMVQVFFDDPLEVELYGALSQEFRDAQDKMISRGKLLKAKTCPKDFAVLLFCNLILEGLLFYANFFVFYHLARVFKGKFNATTANIRYIHRDETYHNDDIFAPMFKEHLKQYNLMLDDVQEDIFNIIKDAVKAEIEWARFVSVPLDDFKILEDFIKHRADYILRLVGYETNPFIEYRSKYPSWFYETAGVSIPRIDSTFQSTVTNYKHANYSVNDLNWS